MATIGDLTRLLDQQTRTLHGRRDDDTVQSHVAGWLILARPMRRAIDALPVGGRKEKLNASLDAVLRPLAGGPRKELPGGLVPAGRLVDVARTTGAIADVLVGTSSGHYGLGLSGGEAVRLEASLLASLHVTARWSRSTLEDQTLPTTRYSLMAALNDLALVTQPWAMIPPSQRTSAFEHLRMPNPSTPGIEGAVVAWANEAWQTLHDRYRVTGWAMQATAGTLALITHHTREAVQREGAAHSMRSAEVDQIAGTLATATRAWREAATWPTNLRLGGSTEELRRLTTGVREAFDAEPRQSLDAMRHVLGITHPVALLQASTMERLVAGRELWIHGVIPNSHGDYARKWQRVPEWSSAGTHLAEAAQAGWAATDQAAKALSINSGRVAPSLPLGWPPACHQAVRVPADQRAPGRDLSIGRGLSR